MAFMFHVDVDTHLACPIWAGVEEVMPFQTFAVLEATPTPLMLPHSNWQIS
jgi:hypothetical protein